MAVEYAPRFTGADSTNAEYRLRNGLGVVAETEPIGAVTDTAVCNDLATKIESSLRANVWQYWGTVRRETYFMRFGPYYFVYVRGLLPEGSVGSEGFTYFVFDAATRNELPLVFDFP
jgi:hypothetical protein